MKTADPKPLLLRLQTRLAASRFFTFSLLLHVILVVMGGSVVLFRQMARVDDFQAPPGELVAVETRVERPKDDERKPVEQTFEPVVPTIVTPPLNAITFNTTATPAFTIPAPTNAVRAPDAVARLDKLMPSPEALAHQGVGTLPDSMAGRMGGAKREAMAKAMGQKEKSERAVLAGLRWLKEHQNDDGSWSDEFRPAMTGLALLCFLGHGELPVSPEFGPTVLKGIDWLLKNGTEAQGRLSMEKAFTQNGVYEHGVAAYALGEYFTMTKDDRVKELLAQAVRYIVDGQAPDGGWQYGFSKGPESDTSVSGWQIQALKAAHLTGLELPGVDDALSRAMGNFKRVRGPNGGIGYRKPEDRYSLTGVGVLCTYFWKGEKDDLVRDGVRFIIEKSEKEFPVRYRGEKADLYAWYYHTQACLMFGGNVWSKWNRWFQDEVADNQSPNGSWPATGNPKPHGAEIKADGAGPVYRTTLCVLMLEVFYRNMPTAKG